jgi:hypothetical protein
MASGGRLIDANGVRLVYASGNPIVYKDDPGSCPCCNDDEPVGAICYPDGTCAEGTATEAANTGGDYQGDGTTCAGTDCDGAICPDGGGACYQGTLAEATAAGDDYIGYGLSCVDVDCSCSDCHFYEGQQMVIESYYEARRFELDDDQCLEEPCAVFIHEFTGTIQFWTTGNPSAPVGMYDDACTFSGEVSVRIRSDNDCAGANQHEDNTETVWFAASTADGTNWTYSHQSSDGTFPAAFGDHNCDGQPASSVTQTCTSYQGFADGRCNPAYCEGEQDPGIESGSHIQNGGFTVT